MPDSEENRPRRAMPPDEPEAGHDDTPEETTAARRYALERQEDAGEAGQDGPTGGQSSSEQANPFARPGSRSAEEPLDTPIPRPSLSSLAVASSTEQTFGKRMGPVAVGPTPAPRRSADSSMTPPEFEHPPAGLPEDSPQGGTSWVRHHWRAILLTGVGVLVLALLLGWGIFSWQSDNRPVVTLTPSPDPVPSATETPEPEATEDNLITEQDAEEIVPGASWVVTETATDRSEFPGRLTCLSSEPSAINPVIALQRQLGTSEDTQLAAMHQVDVYNTVEEAQQVFDERSSAVANCGEVPTYIESSSAVYGIADATLQLTVTFQNDPAQYHSLLLARNGRSISMVDVVRNGEPVAPEALVAGLLGSIHEICGPSEGACPNVPDIRPSLPPVAEPAGWLIPSDLPRLRAGAGLWNARPPAQVTALGTGCENFPLATESGPLDRSQRTFLLTQDDATPGTFGLDQMVFSFGDEESAGQFAQRLVTNLSGCADRVMTAEVEQMPAATGTGAGGAAISSQQFLVTQATSDDANVVFEVAVAAAGQHVTYAVATVTPDYRFGDEQWATLALRAAQRATQG